MGWSGQEPDERHEMSQLVSGHQASGELRGVLCSCGDGLFCRYARNRG